MATPTLILWCDAGRNRLIQQWGSGVDARTPVLMQGDSVGVELHWVNSNSTTSVEEIAFPPSANVILSVGVVDQPPSGGVYKITYGTSTTGELPYSTTASQLQDALNALPSIVAEGGVEVFVYGNTFRIIWNTAGVRTNGFVVNTQALTPSSNAAVVELRAGTTDLSRIMLFSLKRAPIAACTSFTASPAPAATVTSTFSTGWRVVIAPAPKSGTFTVSFVVGTNTYTTIPISVNAAAADVATAIGRLLASTSAPFTVFKSGDYSWDINAPASVKTYDGTVGAVGNLTVTGAIIGFSSLFGTLNMNTAEVEEFLSGLASAYATLEVVVDAGGLRQTIVQTQCIVLHDLIDSSSFTLVDMGSVMPVDSVVRFDTSQALTLAQQLTARQNIAAASEDEITTLSGTVSALNAAVSSISYSIITADQKAAISGAASPSGSNVFITNTALNTGLATRALTSHTHTASQISDSTAAGRSMLTATNAAAQLTLLGGPFAPTANPTFTGLTTLGTSGLRFSDGTTQTTASTGGGGGYNQSLNTTDLVSFGQTRTASVTNGFYITDSYPGTQITIRDSDNKSTAWMTPWDLGISGGYSGNSSLYYNEGAFHLQSQSGSQAIYSGSGITFPDGSFQSTASGGGSLPTPTSGDYETLVYDANISTWTTSANVGRVALIIGSNQVIASGWNSTTYWPSVQVSGSGYTTYYQSNGIYFPDGTFQGTAGGGIPSPSDTSTPWIAVWDTYSSTWTSTNSQSSGQLFRDQADSYQARFGAYTSYAGGPAIQVTDSGWVQYTELNAQGIRFPDGSTQNSAASTALCVIDGLKSNWSTIESQGGQSTSQDFYSRTAVAVALDPTNPPDPPAVDSKCFFGCDFVANGLSDPQLFNITNRPWVVVFKTYFTDDGTHGGYTSGEPWSVGAGIFEVDSSTKEPINEVLRIKYRHNFSSGNTECEIANGAGASSISAPGGGVRCSWKFVNVPGVGLSVYASDPQVGPPTTLVATLPANTSSSSALKFCAFAKIMPNLVALYPAGVDVRIGVADFFFTYTD